MSCYKLLAVLITLLLCFEMSLSSMWSECSRSCGTGISYKTVPCHRLIDDCTGMKKEYKVCNTQECPDKSTDFRTQQCTDIEEYSVSFSDVKNSCKLMCGLPDELPVEKGTVIDGTPCGVSGVCVAGTCIPMGCDGLLGSDKRMDKCERCGATEGVCLHVPCSRTEDEQENVYSVRLPAKSAHIKLRLKSSACDVIAISGNQTFYFNQTPVITISGNKFELNGNKLTSHGPLDDEIYIQIQHCQFDEIQCKYYVPVYKYTSVEFNGQNFDEHAWTVGENYTECSRTCGTGIQISEIYCKNIKTQERVNDSLCKDYTKEDLQPRTRPCSMAECPYAWDKGDWTRCSKSCGGGIKMRDVACIQVSRDGSVSVDDTACHGEKPPTRDNCNEHECYNHWYAEDYNECSNDCGIGVKTREVFCLNAHGRRVDDNDCSHLTKLGEVDGCVGDMCFYRWIPSQWSNCSVDCGDGIQARTVECHRVADNVLVNDSFCISNMTTPKPKTQQFCKGTCCIGEWGHEENWGKCDISACYMEGKQYRNVYCYYGDTLASDDPTIKCDMSQKPKTVRPCNRTSGCHPRWVVVNYTTCTRSCFKTGALQCMQDNEVVSNDLCLEGKPSKIAKCKEHNCTQCEPNGTCYVEKPKCNGDEVPICERIPANTTDPTFQQWLCDYKCCKCKKPTHRFT